MKALLFILILICSQEKPKQDTTKVDTTLKMKYEIQNMRLDSIIFKMNIKDSLQ
jgi:hypothetical protein